MNTNKTWIKVVAFALAALMVGGSVYSVIAIILS